MQGCPSRSSGAELADAPVDQSVVRADPVLRRQALGLLLGSVIAGAAAIYWGLPWLETARLTRPGVQRAICITFAAVIVAIAVAAVTSGFRIVGLGRRTAHLQEFPPPGVKLLYDVHRMTGARALMLGRGYLVIGWSIVVLAITLLGLGGYILVVLWPR